MLSKFGCVHLFWFQNLFHLYIYHRYKINSKCLFTAHVLTEECEGETPMIPSDIMDYSISQTKKTDLGTTLKVLASPSQSLESIPGSDHSTDPVVR